MRHDYHTHSTYSDGEFLWSMLSAAEDAGLNGVGVADHCNVSTRDRPQQVKRAMGFNLDAVYGRRRDAIENLRGRFDLRVFDAVEMDYDPRDEAEIEAFLVKGGSITRSGAFILSMASMSILNDTSQTCLT